MRVLIVAAVALALFVGEARADYWANRYGGGIGPFNLLGLLTGLAAAAWSVFRGWEVGDRFRDGPFLRKCGAAVPLFLVFGFLGSLAGCAFGR